MTIASSPVHIIQWLRITNRSQSLTPAEKSVAVEIASRIGSRTGVCYPSLQTIADAIGLCLSLTKRAVRKLIELGLLAVRYTGRQNVYSLRGLPGCTSDSHQRRPKSTKRKDEVLPPTPAESQIVLDLTPEPTPAPPSAPAGTRADTDASPEPENASAAHSDAADEAAAIIVALIAASGAQYNTRPGSGPHKAAQKALKAGYSVEQIKLVIAWCASTWSNPRFLTPSAVLRVDRLDERIAAAKATAPAGTRAACHKPFEPDKPVQRTAPEVVRGHLAGLKAALSGRHAPS